jgi:hypothetical protein
MLLVEITMIKAPNLSASQDITADVSTDHRVASSTLSIMI